MKIKLLATLTAMITLFSLIRSDNKQHHPTSSFPYEIRMLDSKLGWAFGKHPIKNEMLLLYTSDGGYSWKEINFKEPLLYQKPDFSVTNPSATFFSLPSDDVWLIQEQVDQISVLHSSDKAKTWIKGDSFHIDGIPIGITFINSKTGWITVEQKLGLDYSIDDLYRTNDGGISWEWIAGVKKGTIPQRGEKSAAFFINEHTGIIPFHDNLKQAQIYESSNGGEIWSTRNLAYSGAISKTLIMTTWSPQFFNEGKGILPASIEDPTSDKIITMIYDTQDGGNKWTPSKAIESDKELYQLNYDFISPNSGWLSPDGISLYHREKQQWSKIFVVTSLEGSEKNKQRIKQLDFVTSELGWATIDDGETIYLYETKNSGEKWDKIPTTLYYNP